MELLPNLTNPPTLLAFDLWAEWARLNLEVTLAAFRWLLDAVLGSTQLKIGGAALGPLVEMMRSLGLYMLVPFVLIAVITGIVKGSLWIVLRTLFLSIAIAVLGVPATLFGIQLLQLIDQSITNSILAVSGEQATTFFEALSNGDGDSIGVGPALMLAIVRIVMFVGLLLLFLELLLRDVMIMMVTLFMPLALATSVWQPTRPFLIRMIETLVVLVFARSVAIAVLFIGLAITAEAIGLEQQLDGNFLADPAGFTSDYLNVYIMMITGTFAVWAGVASLPLLLAMVFGPGVYSQTGVRQEYQQSPFAVGSGKAGARKQGRDVVGKVGKNLASKAGKFKL